MFLAVVISDCAPFTAQTWRLDDIGARIQMRPTLGPQLMPPLSLNVGLTVATPGASTSSSPPLTMINSVVTWNSAADNISEMHAEVAAGFHFDTVCETAYDAWSLCGADSPRGGCLPKRALGKTPATSEVNPHFMLCFKF